MALTPAELITAFVMGLVSSGIPIFVTGYVLAVISKPYYGATPENDWGDLVQPYLPDWAVPRTDGEAMRLFYEGLPAGGSIPWGVWLGPLAWWVSFILALYITCFCLVVILRRQWMENERLVFPADPAVRRRRHAAAVPTFSIWFFYLLTLAEGAAVSWAGLTVMQPDAYVWDWHTLSWQAYGAFTAMVVWSLWMARRHLRLVWRKALGHDVVDDATEMVSYRTALILLAAALGYEFVFLWRLGMDVHVAAIYLFGTWVIFLGITRLVVQAGLHYLTSPMQAQALAVAVMGTGFAPQNAVALALTYGCFGDVESIFMPSAAHAAKLNELCGQRRGLAVAMAIAVVTSFAATIWLILHLCYEYGAGNFTSWFFQPGAGARGIAFDMAARQIRDPWPSTGSTGGPCTRRPDGGDHVDGAAHGAVGVYRLGPEDHHSSDRRGGPLPAAAAVLHRTHRRLLPRRGHLLRRGRDLVLRQGTRHPALVRRSPERHSDPAS